MGLFSWLFKKNNKKIKQNIQQTEVEKHYQINQLSSEEKRILNHKAFENDEILNFDPVVGDQVNEKFETFKAKNLKEIANKIKQNQNYNLNKDKVLSPFEQMINNAKIRNDKSVQQVLESSETQRKLKMIEDYQRGNIQNINPDLFTNVNKSITANSYRDRVSAMTSYTPLTIEEELEKRRQLSKQRREALQYLKENTLLSSYHIEKEDKLRNRINALKNTK